MARDPTHWPGQPLVGEQPPTPDAAPLTGPEQTFKILNMRSTTDMIDDRTTAARIRDAAMVRFAADGVAATTVRAIAAEAGVSPALVMHHYGSKENLRVACDRHVAAVVREAKQKAVAAGTGMDATAQLRAFDDGAPLLRYLARSLVDGSPHVADLVDEMVHDAVGYIGQAVETGLMTPSDDPRGRAAVLTLWSLGALVMHEHVHRLLGADLMGGAAGMAPYVIPATEILGRGVLAPGVYEQIRDSFPSPDSEDRS